MFLVGGYSPSNVRADDYPALIPGGRAIDTVPADAVLIAK